jgi:hypothetical protein
MNELAISIAVNCVLGVILWAVLRSNRGGEPQGLVGAADAMQKFNEHFPDALGTAALAEDRCSALLELQRGEIGLLQRHGRRWNARLLAPRDISSVRLTEDGTLHLKFADFAWPQARIRFADPATRALWSDRLRPKEDSRQRLGLRDA